MMLQLLAYAGTIAVLAVVISLLGALTISTERKNVPRH
jgi:hypothetical protein